MKQFVLAIDQGTTGTRSMVVDASGDAKAISYREHRQITPRPGWVEHDPEEIWTNVEGTARAVLKKARLTAADLAGVGIANQGETVMAWDSSTGRPLANAIVWQCDRTRPAVDRLKRNQNLVRRVHKLTGLILDCYFSASKMQWLYEKVPECRRLAREGRLRIGTLDSWLIWKLSNGDRHVTDATTASRTLLMDIESRRWSNEMLELFRISPEWLASITNSVGELATANVNGSEVPILASAVDQQAALYGQCCFRAGMAKCTFGTGAFLLMHTGSRPVRSRHGLLTTIALTHPRRTTYALDGGVYAAGSAVHWLRDMGLIENGSEAAELAQSVADTAGVTFIPCLAGLAAPYWDRRARGLVYGISSATSKAHLVRALLEGIALRVATVAEVMGKEAGHKLRSPLRVDGGLSQNAFLMQFLADMLNMAVEIPSCHESTALGIAYMAGLEAGLFASDAEIERQWQCSRRYEPSMGESERARHLARHRRAIRHILNWNA